MTMSRKQADYVKALRRIGYLPTLEQWAKRATAPIFWPLSGRESRTGVRGGTVCFVNTGSRLIGITAEHVHRDIVERRALDPRIWCQVGGCTFHPETALIEASRELDIATYAFSDIQSNTVGVDVHHALSWPPLASDGAIGLVGGWPWELSEMRPRSVDHSFLHFICQLQVTSGGGIGAATFTESSFPWGAESLPPGTNLGGMSGGPVYEYVPAPIEYLRLVGIVYEYHKTAELVRARSLACVRADGTIICESDA